MIRNETFIDGVCTDATVIDPEAGTISLEEFGVIVSTREMTADEVAFYCPPPAPLPPVGALATLLAVHELVPVQEAADVVGLPVDALVAEAQAWAVAAESKEGHGTDSP